MMQLIVLGEIPGTHFQLTYGWFQLLMLPVLAFAGYKLYQWHTQKQAKQAQRHFDFISLRSLDQA
jgi:hypothetical protein